MESKICLHCGAMFYRKPKTSNATWTNQKACNRQCYIKNKLFFDDVKYCENCGVPFYRNAKICKKKFYTIRCCSTACLKKVLPEVAKPVIRFPMLRVMLAFTPRIDEYGKVNCHSLSYVSDDNLIWKTI